MEQDELNLHIAQGIWEVLKASPEILMSWGLESETVKVVDFGIRFKVNGFKHTGLVEIKLNEGADLYEVSLFNEDGTIKKTQTDIYCDQLVRTIDEMVEYTGEDYQARVDAAYPSLSQVERIVIV